MMITVLTLLFIKERGEQFLDGVFKLTTILLITQPQLISDHIPPFLSRYSCSGLPTAAQFAVEGGLSYDRPLGPVVILPRH